MKENWTYKKFEDSIKKVKYTTKMQSSDYKSEGLFPIVSQEDEMISGYWDNASDVFRVNKPVVIFGDHTRLLKYIDFDFVLGADGVKILQPIDEIIAKFFFYYLKWCKIPSLGYSRHYKLLKEIQVPVPPLSTQSRIVSELDLLQSLIDKQKAQLKEYDTLAQTVFYDMFGDPVENEKGWEVKKLGSFCSKIGSGATPRGGNESYKSEGISLIRSLNVHNNEFIYKDLAFIDEEQAQALSNVEVQLNDILLNITGASVARCCIVPNQLLPARVNQHVCIIRPSKDAKVRFLSRLLTNSQYQAFLIDLARGKAATREALPKNIVEGLPIILPPLSLQQYFAAKIESIEKQKAAISKSIEETQRLFDYTMDKYFG